MNKMSSVPSFRRARTSVAVLLAYFLLFMPLVPVSAQSVKVKRAPAPQGAPQPGKGKEGTGGVKNVTLPSINSVAAGPAISASKVDAYPSAPNPAQPGEIITYTVTITNNGDADALGVVFNDTFDVNTTLVPNSTATQPVASPDTYNVLGNVQIHPDVAAGLLANDCDPDPGGGPCTNTNLTVTGNTSPANGQASVNSDGSFSYNPNPGFTGTDTFTYTVRDRGPDNIAGNADDKTDTATVTLEVGNATHDQLIWFVNSSLGSNGDGRLTSPFNCLRGPGCFDSTTTGGAADDPGDNIFLFASATAYNGGLTLLNNQKLIGQGASGTLAADAGVTVPPNSDALPALNGDPSTVTITTTAASTNGVNINTGNSDALRGFTIGNTTGAKIASPASPPAAAFGTLTVSELILNGAGQALNLDNGTINATFNSISSTNSAGQGIVLDQMAGSITATNGTSITNPTTQCILVSGSTVTASFGNTTCSDATDGISLQNNSSGTRSFGTLSVTGTNTGSAFLHSGGGGNTTVSGAASFVSNGNPVDIQNAGAAAISFAGGATVTKTTAGGAGVNLVASSVTFESLGITTSNGTGLSATTSGTVVVTNGTKSISATGVGAQTAPAIIASGVTLNANFANVSSNGSGTGGNGVSLTNVAGTIVLGGGTLTGAAGSEFFVSGGNPTVTYSGNISQGNAARSVDIQNTTGGAITFNTGNVTDTGSSTGVNISGANGNVSFANLTHGTSVARLATQAVGISGGTGTYTFSTVSIFTNGAQGVVATNADGALNIPAGTIDTTAAAAGATAAAVNIDGPAGLTAVNITLLKVSANNSTEGIHVQDSTGSFTVTGTSTTDGTGGTISNITNRGVSVINGPTISLSNMTLTNVGTANGADPTLSASTCGDVGPAGGGTTGCNAGIHLDTVTGVTLTNIDMNGGNQVGISGNSVTNFVLSNSNVLNFGNEVREDGIKFRNMFGTNSISNTTISGNEAVQVHVENLSGGTQASPSQLTVSDSTISTSNAPNGSSGLTMIAQSTAAMKMIVQGVTFQDIFSNCIEGISEATSGGLDVVVNGNPTAANKRNVFTNCGAGGMNIVQNNAAPVRFNVFNNGTAAAPTFLHNSATYPGTAQPININQAGGAPVGAVMQGAVTSNFIGDASSTKSASAGADGIRALTIAPATLTVLISGNTVRGTAANGINAQMSEDTNAAHRMNATISNNTATVNDVNSFDGIRVVAGAQSTDAGILCADISNNTASGVGDDFTVRPRFNTTVQLPGYTGGATDTAAVQTYLDVTKANNATGPGTDYFLTPQSPGVFANTPGGAACTQPTLPSVAPVTDVNDVPAPAAQTAAAITKSSDITSAPFVSFPQVVKPAKPAKADAQAAASVQEGSAKAEQSPAEKSVDGAKQAAKGSAVRVASTAGSLTAINIGTLKPGDSVVITFQVQINNPLPNGTTQVSNQGTVSGSNFANVPTDDPTPGGTADPTVTLIATPPDIFVRDAKVAEPASGSSNLVFTVALSAPAPSTVSVNFATAPDSGGANPATAGIDYTTTTGTVTFLAGEQIKTISVPVLSDADAAEPDETLLVDLSAPSGGNIVDGQAKGTITAANPPGTVLISELRTSGPGGAGDDFVELYNNTTSPITVASSDGSAGWGLYKLGTGCGAAPALVATITNGTTIPARGHYLLVGSQYSLANYGGTGAAAADQVLTADLESDANVALFSTANLVNVSTENRFDAVGFAANIGSNCDLLREGGALANASGSVSEHSFFRKLLTGLPQDTNDNAGDFQIVSTTPAVAVGANAAPSLGAPGPENKTSPFQRTSQITAALLDPCALSTQSPNRERDFTSDPANNSTAGTLTIRRQFTNKTGVPVTRLRFRIVDVTTFPVGPGVADLRARSSVNTNVTLTAACGSTIVPVKGLTLETPPAQGKGGGYNSTLSAGTVSLGTQLAPNGTINVQFLLGLETSGTFRFLVIVEALP
ncbi:MAG TPA: Ig-like domain-containing protein [Pyrinomonadaceae bacterium]|jgi:uncharacterized repeat protein (TIGR01451 family)